MKDHEFAVCLTHDIDRPYKSIQIPYYALKNRDPSHFRALLPSARPYWQFEEIMSLEDDLGVRSSFYFLNEQNLFRDKSPREWFSMENWKLYTGRYDLTDTAIVEVIQQLDDGGWEVGLHGSYDSYRSPERLRYERERLESVIGHEILGGRQHYLNLDIPETWEYQRNVGLAYDASLGSSSKYGFHHGYDVRRPLGDDFIVFPLTIMECALFHSCSGIIDAKRECRNLLEEARSQDAVMTILWHLRYFNTDEFPGYREVYKYLIQEAQDMGGWIGSCKEYYQRFIQE